MTDIVSTAQPSPLPRDQRTEDAQAVLGQLKTLNKKMKDDNHNAASQRLQDLLAQLKSMVAVGSKSSPAYTALARKIATAARAVAQTGQAVPAAAKSAVEAVKDAAPAGDSASKPTVDIKLDPNSRSADRELLRQARDGIDAIKIVLGQEQNGKKRANALHQVSAAGQSVAAAQSSIAPSTPSPAGIDLSV